MKPSTLYPDVRFPNCPRAMEANVKSRIFDMASWSDIVPSTEYMENAWKLPLLK